MNGDIQARELDEKHRLELIFGEEKAAEIQAREARAVAHAIKETGNPLRREWSGCAEYESHLKGAEEERALYFQPEVHEFEGVVPLAEYEALAEKIIRLEQRITDLEYDAIEEDR